MCHGSKSALFALFTPTKNYMFNEASLSELYTNDLHTSKLIISYIMHAHAYGHKRNQEEQVLT